MYQSDTDQRTLNLSLGQTRVMVSGPIRGAPVLLVHGMTYPLEVWTHCSEALASRGHRVVRFDLYGRGASEWNGTALDSRTLAAQAFEVLDSLGVQQPLPWVSLSNSDLVLLAAFQMQPDRIQQLLWIAPSGFDRRLMNPRVRWGSRIPGIQPWMQSRLRNRCIHRMQAHRTHLPPQATQSSGAIYDQCIDWAQSNPYFAGSVASQIRHLPKDSVVHEQLSQLRAAPIPVHALRFGEEQDSTDQGVAPLLNALPHAKIIVLERGSHMALLEDSEAVNSWILDSLC